MLAVWFCIYTHAYKSQDFCVTKIRAVRTHQKREVVLFCNTDPFCKAFYKEKRDQLEIKLK